MNKPFNSADPALAALIPQVYDELRSLAQRHLRRERPDHTIQPTALVHEAFLRLSNQKVAQWQSREHFIGLASHLMRRILVDHARARSAGKRGDGVPRISLEDLVSQVEASGTPGQTQSGPRSGPDADSVPGQPGIDLEAVDQALTRLEQLDPTQGRIVELRFFGGLTIEETGRVIELSPATVKREWALARAWLHRELAAEEQR
ncbi:MAG TPA: sigma-70 family RNA polymerase sigma factor [Steroidobacteraceae bacterium]|jgi:RNA polymerase sigma factor (sigma-70 family)